MDFSLSRCRCVANHGHKNLQTHMSFILCVTAPSSGVYAYRALDGCEQEGLNALQSRSMHSCMYACTHMFMHVYMHRHACMRMHACIHECIYAHTHIYMYACMCVCTYACTHACINVCMYVCSSLHPFIVCMHAVICMLSSFLIC